MKNPLKTLSNLAALALTGVIAHAQSAPMMVHYQGRVTQANGLPLASPTATVTMRIFPTASGGTALWDSGPRPVILRNGGIFSVMLGDTSVGMPGLTQSVFQSGIVYLELSIQGQAQPVGPRQPIVSVPWSILSQQANIALNVVDGAITTAKLANDAVTTAKLANGAVTTAKIADGTINENDIASNAITGPKLADGSVSQPKISVNSIDSTRLATDLASLGKITNGRLQSEANRLIVWGDSSQSRVSFLGAPGVPSGIEFNRQPFGQAFTLEQRSDVGGNNSDLKLLRYVLGGYQGIALQVQNSTGNVGVNSSAPKERLHVEGNLLVSNGGNTANAGGAVNFSAYPSTENSRTVFAYIKGALSLGDSNGQVGNLEFWTRPATSSNSFVRRMMIRLDGAVAIGDGEPNGATLSIYGSANKRDNSSLWDAWSDQRLKKDISDIENPLSRLLRLKGRTFAWRDTMDMAKHNPGRKMGFIAQETEKVFPEWVRQAENGYKLLNPEGIYALTVEAIREQQNQIETLRKENERLRLQNAGFEARLRALESKVAR
ncbi:MAG TPA: tail fiber domain-containing protein [Fimbriimonadaceae bacterium]|nr:tail fiber domain-containing protein [Fimbriimonadaceae bacterium]